MKLWQFCVIPALAWERAYEFWVWERTGRSKNVFDWLSIDWILLRSADLDSQCKGNRSTVQHSCSKLLLGKHLLGTGCLLGSYIWTDCPLITHHHLSADCPVHPPLIIICVIASIQQWLLGGDQPSPVHTWSRSLITDMLQETCPRDQIIKAVVLAPG